MSTPPIDGAPQEEATHQDARDERLRRMARLNRRLISLVVILLVGVAGLGGWLLGRGQGPGALHGEDVHANCPFDLPSRGEALVRSIRCGHGTPIIEAHCPEGHGMKSYILDLFKQGLSDQDVKAALLRRYGEKELAGREW